MVASFCRIWSLRWCESDQIWSKTIRQFHPVEYRWLQRTQKHLHGVHKWIIHNSYEWSSDTEVQLKHLTVTYTAMIDIYEVRDKQICTVAISQWVQDHICLLEILLWEYMNVFVCVFETLTDAHMSPVQFFTESVLPLWANLSCHFNAL